MLTLKSTCVSSLNQYAIVNVGGKDAIVYFTHDLYVCMAFYAGLPQCMSEGVYCWRVCWLAMKYSMYFDVSLSILWSFGLNPLLLQYAQISLYALNKSSLYLLFSGIPLMKRGSLM